MNLGRVITAPCENTPPPPDSRCDDPAFRLNNPDICPTEPSLIIKPGVVLLCSLGSVQFKAFLLKDGVEEDVTTSCVFTSSNANVAVIGAYSGNATATGVGNATIHATFGEYSAHADVEVLFSESGNCCDDVQVAFMVMVDHTKSMSQGFNGDYTTKLAFAKAAAERLISEVNEEKDVVGLLKFNAAATVVLSSPTSDKDAVEALVSGINQTSQSTSYYDALEDAISELDDTAADRKVIVLITDGEDQTESYDDDNNPIALLDTFKASGGIVVCVGVRSHGASYNLLSSLATGGFFVNGHDEIAEDVLDYVSGLKGYICAGNCVDPGDEYVATGQLNYTDFINWTVSGGYFDLQGNGFFDYLPGNGLYVDLISGAQPSGVANPELTLATPLTIQVGKIYRVSVRLGGNQCLDNPGTVLVKVISATDSTVYLQQSIHIDDYRQPFQNYGASFTALYDDTVIITIQQTESTGLPTPLGFERCGILLDKVMFECVTDSESLFIDDFDSENIQYVAPACGIGATYVYLPAIGGYGYSEGYDCYGEGCLDEPPPSQTQDPNPLIDIESGYVPPTTYTSTKTVCKECPEGFINAASDPLELTYVSSALGPPKSTVYQLTAGADIVQMFYLGPAPSVYGLSYETVEFYGSNNGTSWTLLGEYRDVAVAAGSKSWFLVENNSTEYLYYKISVASVSPDTLTTVPFNLLDADALYGVASQEACATESAESEISQADADEQARLAAEAEALSALNCMAVYTATEEATATCSLLAFGNPVTRSATRSSLNSLNEAELLAQADAQELADAALDCTMSNNDREITIADATGGGLQEGDPYPSVRYVEETGVIAKVTVAIYGLSHDYSDDVRLLLQSPSGTAVEIMRNCGGSNVASNLDIVFDDDAASPLPDAAALSSGTFQTSVYGAGGPFPEPAAQGYPYPTSLSEFIGENPEGSWLLFVCDDASSESGAIANGWDLTITLA